MNLGLDEAEDLFQTRQDRGGARVQWQEFKESKGIFQVTRYRTMEIGVDVIMERDAVVERG